MTSNLGGDILLEGNENAKKEVDNLLKSTFRPEFLNRIDEIITFKPLGKMTQRKIVDKLLSNLSDRLKNEYISLSFTDKLKDWILDKSYTKEYGARPVKRFIQKEIETFIAKAIIKGELNTNKKYVLDQEFDKLILR